MRSLQVGVVVVLAPFVGFLASVLPNVDSWCDLCLSTLPLRFLGYLMYLQALFIYSYISVCLYIFIMSPRPCGNCCVLGCKNKR